MSILKQPHIKTYKINPDELSNSPVYRYSSTVKNQHQITSSLLTDNPASIIIK